MGALAWGLHHPSGEQWWASESTVGDTSISLARIRMARGGSLPQHAHLGGGEKMWEGISMFV